MEKLLTYTAFSPKGQEMVNIALPPNVDEDAVLTALFRSPGSGIVGALQDFTVEKETVAGKETITIHNIMGDMVLYLREASGDSFL